MFDRPTPRLRSVLPLLGLACALGPLAAPALAQDGTKIRWKFEDPANKSIPYVMETRASQKMSIQGQNIATDQKQTIEMTWTVDGKAGDDAFKVMQQVDRVRMNVDAPTGKFDFDTKSDKPVTGPLAAAVAPLKALVEAPIQLSMTDRGEIKETTIDPKVVESLKSSALGATGMANEESLKKMTTQGSMTFPEKPLAKGDSWDAKIEVPMGPLGSLVVNRKYTYEGQVKEGDATLEKFGVKGDVSIKAGDNAAIQLDVTDQKVDGTILFDNAKGRLERSEVDMSMTMKIKAGGQQIEQNIVNHVTQRRGKATEDAAPAASPGNKPESKP